MAFEEKLNEMYNEIANKIQQYDTGRMGNGICNGLCK